MPVTVNMKAPQELAIPPDWAARGPTQIDDGRYRKPVPPSRKAVTRVQHLFERHREYQRRREEQGFELGFTLIELLIVIVVLAILAAIVIFSISGVKGQSEAAACNSDAKTVETAVSAYDAEVGTPPATLAFTDLTTQSATVPGSPFLKAAPVATITNNGYVITLDTTTAGQVDVATQGNAATPYDSGGAALCNAL